MNQTPDTASALLAAARELFASDGYRGASVRAITRHAGANLGAVTYHFGSKEALYESAMASVAEPLRQHLASVASQPGTPLQRIELLVRAAFDHLAEHPELPSFMVQHLASQGPLPEAVARVLEGNHALFAGLIGEGQADGSIRPGDPRLMALSVAAQPIWLSVVRRFLEQALGVNQRDPATRSELVNSVVSFVRAGLEAAPGEAP
jgi:AcrR family transcriptional regulator